MARQKWKEWAEDTDRLRVLAAWARAGMTDEEIAKEIGISRSTLSEWKKTHAAIREALNTGKEIADRLAEHSLYIMTQERRVKVRKAYKLKRKGKDERGNPYEEEYLEYGEEEIYIPPDIKAVIFWLKNRKSDYWRDKVAAAAAGEDEENTGMIILTPRMIKEMEEEVKKGESEEKKQER